MSEHSQDCDVNDINPDGIRKPCNCRKSSFTAPTGSAHMVKRVSKMNEEEIAAAIEASHPMETEDEGVMDADALAMHLVGARHEKRELVNLVRWLLIGAPVDKAYASGMEAGREAERQECCDAINKWIKPGDLPGNGCDETAQRNGMILARNLIMERIAPNADISDRR